MKISFLVTGFKVRTGITDYTLALARECLEQNHSIQILALNAISSSDEAEIVGSYGDDILEAITSISPPLIIRKKIYMAERYLQHFDPDWISLQFQYQYFRQGHFDDLSYLSRFLRLQKSKGRKTNIFIHEIWRDPTDIENLKSTLLTWTKRLLITHFLKSSKADLILTSNMRYVESLQAAGISSKQLPILNNIPVCSQNVDRVTQEIQKCSGLNLVQNRLGYCVVGILGSLVHHPEGIWEVEPLFSELLVFAQESQREVVLAWVGRQNAGSRKQWTRVVNRYNSQLNFVELGIRDSEFVSQFFQVCDWGLSTTKFDFLGKSGSISAMLCHGLTVLFNEGKPDFDIEKVLAPYYSIEQISFGVPDFLEPIKRPCFSNNAQIAQKFSEFLVSEL